MQRSIEEVNARINKGDIVSLRLKIVGGETGDHFVQYLTGEWRCDCQGYMAHAKCRHIRVGEVVLSSLKQTVGEFYAKEVYDHNG